MSLPNQQFTVSPLAFSGLRYDLLLFLGLLQSAGVTREALTSDGWLHTGDKGQVDGKGLLTITGRVKDLFKTSKGKYVAPAPIEDKLVMHEAIEACEVTGANLGQPLGIVMLNAEAAERASNPASRAALDLSLTQHLHHLNETLDPHERLSCLVVVTKAWTVDNDLITPSFKVKRIRIEALYASKTCTHRSTWAGKPWGGR